MVESIESSLRKITASSSVDCLLLLIIGKKAPIETIKNSGIMSENQIVYGATLFDKTVTEYEIVKANDFEQYFDVIQDGTKLTEFGAVQIAQICRKMAKGMENTLFDMLRSGYTKLKIRMEIEV